MSAATLVKFGGVRSLGGRHPGTATRLLVLLILGGLIPGLTAPAAAVPIEAAWNGGAGNWSSAANWTPNQVPNNGSPGATDTYNVRVDNGNAVGSSVSLDVIAGVDNLTIDVGDSLGINAARRLNVAGGGVIFNAGTINLNGSGTVNVSELRMDGGAVTLAGGGTVTLTPFAVLKNQVILPRSSFILCPTWRATRRRRPACDR
jgi:hypothetical protein